MSRRFWTGMLRKAIATLMGANWAEVRSLVLALMNSELSGEEKKRLARLQLRMLGADGATWLLSAAIEVTYGEAKEAAAGEE